MSFCTKTPAMKKDITTRQDIEQLVNGFYKKIKVDDSIGFFFTEVARVNWDRHLPIMYDFFDNLLFYTGSYTGNPMEMHKHINRQYPFTEAHFNRWIQLFNETVDELFQGSTASLAKKRASSIASVMKLKLTAGSASSDSIF